MREVRFDKKDVIRFFEYSLDDTFLYFCFRPLFYWSIFDRFLHLFVHVTTFCYNFTEYNKIGLKLKGVSYILRLFYMFNIGHSDASPRVFPINVWASCGI